MGPLCRDAVGALGLPGRARGRRRTRQITEDVAHGFDNRRGDRCRRNRHLA